MKASGDILDVSVLLLQEGEWWSALCLDYDVSAQAKSIPDLRKELERVLFLHISLAIDQGRAPFDGSHPAPRKYWDMFTAATLRVESDELLFKFPENLACPPIAPKLRIAEPSHEFA